MTIETRDKAGYKNLIVFKKANDLALYTYKVTKKFPKEELFGLTSQMRRCAISIPANIVEGYGRKTPADKAHFYYISRGSLNELECYLDLSHQLNYITQEDYLTLTDLRAETGKLLTGFIKSTQT